MKRIKAFNEVYISDFLKNRLSEIENELDTQNKEYILSVDENEYIKYLVDKYILETIQIDFGSEMVESPTTITDYRDDRVFGRIAVEGYLFSVNYSFTGNSRLFSIIPSRRTHTTYDIFVDDTNGKVGFNFAVFERKPEVYENEKSNCRARAFVNTENVNNEVTDWNSKLLNNITKMFKEKKEKFEAENNFFEAINIKINSDTKTIFTTPTIKKVIVPQPEIPKGKKYSSEPTMNPEMYYDVLKVIYEAGKGMEKKPTLYQGKDEEGLRDQFLFVLETRYDGVTAAGETFNRIGKTDILLKYSRDNSNLFVAECKFWRGESEYHNAINQLFERYLTWRDSKVALIIFVKNQGFSNILIKLKDETKRHNLFHKEIGSRGESSFSYEFCLPQDKEKIVYLEVMAFHFEQQ